MDPPACKGDWQLSDSGRAARGPSSSPLRLVLGGFGRSREQSGFALVLKPGALAVDVDVERVVQDAIEHRRSEDAAAGGDCG